MSDGWKNGDRFLFRDTDGILVDSRGNPFTFTEVYPVEVEHDDYVVLVDPATKQWSPRHLSASLRAFQPTGR